MDYDQIKQLMKDMENSKLEAINIELADGTKISMKKEQEAVMQMIPTQQLQRETTSTYVQETTKSIENTLPKRTRPFI